MENIALIDSFSEFKDNKSIDRVTLMSILEEVFRAALKRKFGSDDNFDIIINPDKGDLEIWRNREIVEDNEFEDEITEIHPNVLGVTGPHAYDEVLNQIHEHVAKPQHNPHIDLVPDHGVKLTPKHYAYLKISEGCNRTCSFCAIPLMRGKHISQPIDKLVKEAENLARMGVKELMLIAQELTYYGLDLYKKRALPELLHALAKIK